jgi:hypothetical protein
MQIMDTTVDSQHSLIWVCTHPSLFAAAKATLDDEYTATSTPRGKNMAFSGRMGTAYVSIYRLPHPLDSKDFADPVQNIVRSPTASKSILITTLGVGYIDHKVGLGDLAIARSDIPDQGGSEPLLTRKRSLAQQAAILQREIGPNGRWL